MDSHAPLLSACFKPGGKQWVQGDEISLKSLFHEGNKRPSLIGAVGSYEGRVRLALASRMVGFQGEGYLPLADANPRRGFG